MLWIISAAAVAGIAAAGVFAALWWVQWRKARRYMDAIIRKDGALNDARNDCDRWKHEACVHLERERAAVEQAKLFERVSKTMEEHAAAERGRAERLAAALRESEDKREQLGNKFKIVENALIQCEERLGKANGENKDLKTELKKLRCAESAHPMGTVLDEMKKRGEAQVFSAAMQNNLAREFANIEAYNGTAEGQVDLTDE